MLSDPARRAAYDRALRSEQQPAARVRVTVRRSARPGGPGRHHAAGAGPPPPLRAGPVLVEGAPPARAPGGWDERDIRLAVLADLALRHLARDRDWPW